MNLREAEMEEMRNQRDEARAEVERLAQERTSAVVLLGCHPGMLLDELRQVIAKAEETPTADDYRRARAEVRSLKDELRYQTGLALNWEQSTIDARAEVERLRGLIAGWSGRLGFNGLTELEAEMRAEVKKSTGESVTDAAAEVERLKILGPDTAERVTCEARVIAAEMMQPALQAWKEENETLRAEVERLKGLIGKWADDIDCFSLEEASVNDYKLRMLAEMRAAAKQPIGESVTDAAAKLAALEASISGENDSNVLAITLTVEKLEKQLAEAKALCREAAEMFLSLPYYSNPAEGLIRRLRAMGGE